MATLFAGTGIGGAASVFYSRHRIPLLAAVLSLVGVVTGTTTALALLQNLSVTEPLVASAGALLAAACCVAQTRHLGLAAATAAAPLPGLLWAAPLSGGSSFGAVPAVAYAFGFVLAALEAETAVRRALDGDGERPWQAAAVAVGMTAFLAVLWFFTTPLRGAALQGVADMALGAVSAAVLMPVAVSLLRFDENFVARANRARERRQRFSERMALVAEPRWAMSFCGIAVVFLALGWFGALPAMRQEAGAVALRAVSLAAVVIAAGFFLRGWREGVATGFAVATAGLIGLWAIAAGARDVASPAGALEAAGLALFLALFGGRCWRHYWSFDEPRRTSLQRAIEAISAGEIFAVAGAVLAVVPAAIVRPAGVAMAVAVLAAGAGGTVWAAAAAGVLETLVPRRRRASEMYAPHRRSHA